LQDGARATVAAVNAASGEQLRIGSQIVAGCDGAGSAVVGALRNASVSELRHPFRWLTLLADVGPSKPTTLYGFHRRGFAGQMRRGRSLTRYMLEVALSDAIEDWPDDRIWSELQQRLRAVGEPRLAEGGSIERDVLSARSRRRTDA
jgi:p-hydroxybenzoate 3-monooxygenase